MKNKKILLITIRSDIGGGPKAVYDLARTIKKDHPNINISIAAPRSGYYSDRFKEVSSSFIPIPHRKFSIITLFKLLLFVLKNNVAIIHSHGRGAGYYSRLLKITGRQIIHTFHGVHDRQEFSFKLKNRIDSFLKYLTNKFICVSKQESIIAKELKLISSSFEIIPNGINLDLYRQKDQTKTDQFHKLFDKKDSEIILGTLSRLDFQKGNDLLINHFSKLLITHPNYKLIIAGTGAEQNNLQTQITNLNLNEKVKLIGETTDPINFLHSIDIFVSGSRGEGLPISVLEALATSTPCVLSKVSGHIDTTKESCLFTDSGEFIDLILDPVITPLDLEKYSIINTTEKIVKQYNNESNDD